jgi:hypothetical protein
MPINVTMIVIPTIAAAMTANLSALPDMSSFVGIKTRTLPLVRGSPDPLLRYAAGTVRLPAAGQVGLWLSFIGR